MMQVAITKLKNLSIRCASNSWAKADSSKMRIEVTAFKIPTLLWNQGDLWLIYRAKVASGH